MRHVVANTTLTLCHGGIQKVGEVECPEAKLVEDEIVYCGSVGDASLSTNIPSQSTSDLGPSIS